MKPIRPVRIPRTIADLLDPEAANNLLKAQKQLNAICNMQMQITINDGTGTPRVGVGRIQLQGDSAVMQVTL